MPTLQQTSTLDYTVSAEMVQGLIDCAVRCGVPRASLAGMIQQPHGSKSASMPPAHYAAQHVFALWERHRRYRILCRQHDWTSFKVGFISAFTLTMRAICLTIRARFRCHAIQALLDGHAREI